MQKYRGMHLQIYMSYKSELLAWVEVCALGVPFQLFVEHDESAEWGELHKPKETDHKPTGKVPDSAKIRPVTMQSHVFAVAWFSRLFSGFQQTAVL